LKSVLAKGRLLRLMHQGLAERDTQRLDEFLACGFLSVDAGDFFDPADPPRAVLFQDGGVSGLRAGIIPV
jgi:hypothetical protein